MKAAMSNQALPKAIAATMLMARLDHHDMQ